VNNRRKLFVVPGASALAAPFAPFPHQPGKVLRIGWIANVRGIARRVARSRLKDQLG
jgi:hypothetical protein